MQYQRTFFGDEELRSNWTPSAYLSHAERLAHEIRRELAFRDPASTNDALSLLKLIEELARHGQRVGASEALEIAESVERLFDHLLAKIEGPESF